MNTAMSSASSALLSAVAAQRYQRLSTTVSDHDTGLEAAFAVYPSAYRVGPTGRHFPIPRCEDFHPGSLGFEETRPADHLPPSSRSNEGTWLRAIAAALNPDLLSRHELKDGSYRWSEQLGDIDVPPAEMAFARYLFEQPIIPWRRSPLTGQPLANLIGKATGAGTGGVVGVYAGIDHGLLLLVTAPGGMIVGGTAMAVATALEIGLHERILRLILPPADEPTSSASAPVTSARGAVEVQPLKQSASGSEKGKHKPQGKTGQG